MKWLTRENVGIDRIGCAWLITRFIDPDAEFIFIPVDIKRRCRIEYSGDTVKDDEIFQP